MYYYSIYIRSQFLTIIKSVWHLTNAIPLLPDVIVS